MKAPLMTLDEAWERLAAAGAAAAIQAHERVPALSALGRVLAEPVHSLVHVPPLDNSAMDGYALRVADCSAVGDRLAVSQRIPAGSVGRPLEPGTAARIFTGAPIPPGADAVVMQEHCEVLPESDSSGRPLIRLADVPTRGSWIRRQGEDVGAGATVLCQGQRLNPQALGLIASVGISEVVVIRRPRVALFSTGDELVMPGSVPPEQLPPGAIFNSNRYTLRGLLESSGCTVIDLGIVPDSLEATRAALQQAAEAADVIVTSGGVSVGEEDHVKPAVLSLGRLDLWQLAIKPGKPLALGHVDRPGRPPSLFVGLPGNPVSSFVTFLVAVMPLLRAMTGQPWKLPAPVRVRADFEWPRPDRRREFLRVRVNDAGGVSLYANQSSGVLTSAVWATGLVDVPPGMVIRAGDSVAYRSFGELLQA